MPQAKHVKKHPTNEVKEHTQTRPEAGHQGNAVLSVSAFSLYILCLCEKRKLHAMKKKQPPNAAVALICTLCLGGVCVYLGSLLCAARAPDLFVNFVRKPDGSLPLHFFNARGAGEEEIALDVAGMQRFLFHPASGGNKYILQVRNRPFGPDEAENRRRLAAVKTLAPQEAFEIGDLRPVIAALPDTTLSLVAVYSGDIEVRSLPLTLREEGK